MKTQNQKTIDQLKTSEEATFEDWSLTDRRIRAIVEACDKLAGSRHIVELETLCRMLPELFINKSEQFEEMQELKKATKRLQEYDLTNSEEERG